MPSVNIISSYNRSLNDISILRNYINGCVTLDAQYQYMIGEVVMLRLFSVLESTISETAFKLACGATYRNGTYPLVLLRCRSLNDASHKMLTHNRRRPIRFLHWTKHQYIQDSIEHVLDISDRFYINVQNHGSSINEMRIVRNHVAHRSNSTRQEYKNLLRQLYGGNTKINLGAFLVSTKRAPLANIQRYISTTRIIINDITNG